MEPTLPRSLPQTYFVDTLLKYWVFILFAGSIIWSYSHAQGQIEALQKTQDAQTLKASVIEANYNEVSGNIKEINAKLDIIIKKVQL